jgi:putative flippase GtrA
VITGERREIPVSTASDSIAICDYGFRVFSGRLVRLVAKQQTAALLATLVDYAVMAACASGAGMSAASATACGSLVGMFVGFALGRRWVFRAVETNAFGQAWRYLAVSLVSLLANAGGEALLVGAGLHYLAARPIISIAVGLGWNLPMQQFFVFRRT